MSLGSKPTRREQQHRAIERMVTHRLFHRMVARQGIDLAGGWSRGMEEMISQALRRCERCTDTVVCRDWLRSDSRLASYIAFCPNTQLIETCRILAPDAAPLKAEPPDVESFDDREPSLAETLAEPIIQLLMASDHFGAEEPHRPSTDPPRALDAAASPYRHRGVRAGNADIAEDQVMPEPISLLRQEHRNMVALLLALEWQIGQFEDGRQPDYDVIEAALDYFLAFPDVYHHPKEERIFAKLRERDDGIAQRLGDLGLAHQELAARARDFATALRAVLQDIEVSREALARWAHGFIDLQRRHIDMEESTFFPAAAKALTAQDWSDLEAQLAAEDALLVDDEDGEKLEQLRKKILGWQAQDQAALAPG